MPTLHFANFLKKIVTFSSFICLLTVNFYKMQFQVLYFTFICYQLILIREFIPKMKYLWVDFMFLSKINQVILVANSGFKVSVTSDLLCDILLSLIPFWSDYLSSKWMVFSDKQNYRQVNKNYMAKSRWQHNVLWIFQEIVTFSSFICLKKSAFFCYCFQLLSSFIYFLFIDS